MILTENKIYTYFKVTAFAGTIEKQFVRSVLAQNFKTDFSVQQVPVLILPNSSDISRP